MRLDPALRVAVLIALGAIVGLGYWAWRWATPLEAVHSQPEVERFVPDLPEVPDLSAAKREVR